MYKKTRVSGHRSSQNIIDIAKKKHQELTSRVDWKVDILDFAVGAKDFADVIFLDVHGQACDFDSRVQ